MGNCLRRNETKAALEYICNKAEKKFKIVFLMYMRMRTKATNNIGILPPPFVASLILDPVVRFLLSASHLRLLFFVSPAKQGDIKRLANAPPTLTGTKVFVHYPNDKKENFLKRLSVLPKCKSFLISIITVASKNGAVVAKIFKTTFSSITFLSEERLNPNALPPFLSWSLFKSTFHVDPEFQRCF